LTSSRKPLKDDLSSNDDEEDADDEEYRDREPEKATISSSIDNQKLLFNALTN
jgi:hypothetical protein